jgi:N-acetylglutamate synthase-like GNAT family acetyltransferase
MSKNDSFKIRHVTEKDVSNLLMLVKELAKYERLVDQFEATSYLYLKHGFGKEPIFKALIAENLGLDGPKSLGMAIYFFTFSTFLGKPTLYLEDLFVLPEYRGRGVGKRMLLELTKIAVEKDCGRMEWSVLNWNEPSINFYLSLGAKPMNEWTVYRLEKPDIIKLAENQKLG